MQHRDQSWEQQMLPLRFAQVNDRVRKELAHDWERYHDGPEWSYCIRAWDVGFTKDRDTVFVVTKIEPNVNGKAKRHSRTDADCLDANGKDAPVLHAHPSRDCSPSRDDISGAMARPDSPFEMIVCGPGVTFGYTGRMYRELVAGRAARGDVREMTHHVEHDTSLGLILIALTLVAIRFIPRLHRMLQR